MQIPHIAKFSCSIAVAVIALGQLNAWASPLPMPGGNVDPVPRVQADPMPQSQTEVWVDALKYRMRDLGTRSNRVDVSDIPTGEINPLSERVRNQLRDRMDVPHLLYLGSTERGSMYAFPLTDLETNLRMPAPGPSNQYHQLALISITPPGPAGRSIYLHDVVGAWMQNKYAFLERVMTPNADPTIHDLGNLLQGRIHGF